MTRSLILAAPFTLVAGLAAADAPHACGGIGAESQAVIEAAPHTLRLVYAEPDGAYLGDIDTRIMANGETVVSAHCDGPILIADLPTGSYEVEATFRGQTKTFTAQAGAGAAVETVVTFQ